MIVTAGCLRSVWSSNLSTFRCRIYNHCLGCRKVFQCALQRISARHHAGNIEICNLVFGPIVDFFRPIPPLAWIPLSIVWFGITDAQNQFIIFLAALFPIVLNTIEGVRDVDKQLVRASKTLGARPAAIIATVILPAALPAMFVGFRSATGIAWMALVAGELVAATSGLGFLISQGRMLFRSDFIIVGMLVIGLIGIVLDGLVRLIQQIVMPWKES